MRYEDWAAWAGDHPEQADADLRAEAIGGAEEQEYEYALGARKYPRDLLKVERLYHEIPTGMYFFTPDGVGCIWYDTLEEAMEDTEAFGEPIIGLNQELED